MSPLRLIGFSLFATLCVVWAVTALYGHSIRLENQDLIASILEGEKLPEAPVLDKAITEYQEALAILPCNLRLHQDLGILLALRTDTALAGENLDSSANALDAMKSGLENLLACTPNDGKAWLDLAMIDIYREGFTEHALTAYKTSARVAPGESWLAEKRLLFALEFNDLLDADARKVIGKDIIVLERAHPNRIKAVMEAAKVETPQALRDILRSA